MLNNIIFFVVERHMMANYTLLDKELKKLSIPYKVYYLPEMPNQTIKNRIFGGKHYLESLRLFCLEKFPNGIRDSLIFYSNAEGFVLSNKDIWMPNVFNCREVILQHGFMPTKYGISYSRLFINKISNYILKFNLIGLGFGGVRADKAIVMGSIYKELLVAQKGWEESNVIISGKILKPDILLQPVANNNVCLFLLQDVSRYYNFDVNHMLEDFQLVCDTLCNFYETVILRKHPKMNDSVYEKLCISEKVVRSYGKLEDDIKKSIKVFSFFSSALVDASLMGRDVVAIKIPGVPDDAYRSFRRTVKMENLKDYLRHFATCQDVCASIDIEYFDSSDNICEVIDCLLN